jgi:hypothetical protein
MRGSVHGAKVPVSKHSIAPLNSNRFQVGVSAALLMITQSAALTPTPCFILGLRVVVGSSYDG